MAISDKLKKIGADLGTGIKKGIENARENARENAERRDLKERLLTYFTLNEKKGMLRQYGESLLPEFKTDPLTGDKTRTNADDWTNHCISEISLKNMVTFAKQSGRLKNNPYVRDMIIEIDKWIDQNKPNTPVSQTSEIATANNPNSELTNLLNEIKVNFEEEMGDQHYHNEDEFNKALVGWLRSRYRDRIEDPHNIHQGDLGDIVYHGAYGRHVLELKLAYGGTLDYGYGEIARYKASGNYVDVGIIIWDTGELPYDSLKNEKTRFEAIGAKVIIIRPRGGRSTIT
jgi:hypothetical protein